MGIRSTRISKFDNLFKELYVYLQDGADSPRY